jgi:hypothetical protein
MSYNKPEKGDFGDGPKVHKIRIVGLLSNLITE